MCLLTKWPWDEGWGRNMKANIKWFSPTCTRSDRLVSQKATMIMTIIALSHVDTNDNDDLFKFLMMMMIAVGTRDEENPSIIEWRTPTAHPFIQWWWWWSWCWWWWWPRPIMMTVMFIGVSKGATNMFSSYFHGCQSTIENCQPLIICSHNLTRKVKGISTQFFYKFSPLINNNKRQTTKTMWK